VIESASAIRETGRIAPLILSALKNFDERAESNASERHDVIAAQLEKLHKCACSADPESQKRKLEESEARVKVTGRRRND
jgi:uncharacterized protein YllA (UPF0747 family)